MQDIPNAREEIRRLIESDDQAAAEQVLRAALRRWPDQPGIKVLQGEFFARTGRIDAAAESYAVLAREHPDFFWAGVRLVRLLHEHRRTAEAHTAFAELVWLSAAPDDLKGNLLTQIAGRGIEPATAERLLARLQEEAPRSPLPLAMLAAIRLRQHRYREALALLERAASLGSLPWLARLRLVDLLNGAGRAAEALTIAEQIHAEQPDRPEGQHRLIRALTLLGMAERAADLIGSALRARPHDWMLLYRTNRLPLAPAAAGVLFTQIRALAALPETADEKWQFQYAVACLEAGATQDAIRVLSRIPSGTPAARMAEPLRRAIASRPAASWNAGRLRDDRSRDVQVVRVVGAEATILVFTGLGGRLAYLPVSHLDVLLAAFPANVVYLRDVKSRAYLDGIASLGDLAGTLVHLARLIEQLGAPHLVAMGNSIGGFGAVRYAARLGAAAALSFAGPTTLDSSAAPDLAAAAEMHNEPGVRELAMQEVAENDLVPDIAGSPAMRVIYCFGAASDAERAHGRRIEAFANVVLRPVPGCDDHFVPLHVIARGEFEPLLAEALGPERPT